MELGTLPIQIIVDSVEQFFKSCIRENLKPPVCRRSEILDAYSDSDDFFGSFLGRFTISVRVLGEFL